MYARADRTGNQVGQGEIDYWTGQLDSGALSPAGFEKAFTTARNEQYKAQGLGTPRELISSSAFAQMRPEGYLPRETTMGGVTGYSSGNLYDQALAELAVRNPAQMERYGRVMNPNINPQAYTQAANAQLPEYGQVMARSGGGSDMGSTPNYWAEREAQVGKAQAFAEQSAQNQKISDALTGFGKMGFGGILGAITGGTPGNTRAPVVDRNIYRTGSSGGGDYGSYSGAGDAQTAASLSSDNTGGFYG